MWIPLKVKYSMTMKQSMVIGLCDANVTERPKSLLKVELAVIELLVLTFVDSSVFPNGQIPEEYISLFNGFRANGIQRIEKSLWYR